MIDWSSYGHGKVEDGLVKDGLWDVYNDFHMGNCAEKCAAQFNFTREVRAYSRSWHSLATHAVGMSGAR